MFCSTRDAQAEPLAQHCGGCGAATGIAAAAGVTAVPASTPTKYRGDTNMLSHLQNLVVRILILSALLAGVTLAYPHRATAAVTSDALAITVIGPGAPAITVQADVTSVDADGTMHAELLIFNHSEIAYDLSFARIGTVTTYLTNGHDFFGGLEAMAHSMHAQDEFFPIMPHDTYSLPHVTFGPRSRLTISATAFGINGGWAPELALYDTTQALSKFVLGVDAASIAHGDSDAVATVLSTFLTAFHAADLDLAAVTLQIQHQQYMEAVFTMITSMTEHPDIYAPLLKVSPTVLSTLSRYAGALALVNALGDAAPIVLDLTHPQNGSTILTNNNTPPSCTDISNNDTGGKATSANAHTVLALGITLNSGCDSYEVKDAQNDGYDVTIVSNAAWDALSREDFASYRALLLGDRSCNDVSVVDAATRNRAVWGGAVGGNVVVLGTDPVFHAIFGANSSGAQNLMAAAMNFATGAEGTGAYIALSCYEAGSSANTPVSLLGGLSSQPSATGGPATSADNI